MKRLLLAVALASACPFTAAAQFAPPVGIRGPMAPSYSRTSHGITVNGGGNATIAATSARITLHMATVDNRLALSKESIQPVVDALIKAGADPATVVYPVNFSAPGASNFATISAIVHNPTVAMMKSGVVTVGTAVAALPNVRLSGAEVLLHADNCASTQAKARQAAIATARAKATQIAKELSLSLGSVIDVNATDQSSADASCASQYYVGPNGAQFNVPFGEEQSDSDYVTITVHSFVTLTYAIR